MADSLPLPTIMGTSQEQGKCYQKFAHYFQHTPKVSRPVIPILRMLRQGDEAFKANTSYRVQLCLKKEMAQGQDGSVDKGAGCQVP